MKKISTLFVFSLLFFSSQSQVVLNEVYTIPGAGKHEFFEFYNTSVNAAPEQLDNYTLVTYFQEPGNKKGFYVLDIPNLSVAPKGFFVGSAALPFNYQGIANSTASDFNWNDLTFMAANNGYLRKWVMATAVPEAMDGNANYDLEALPANFNDLFVKVGGVGASYMIFIYKNGLLINAFLGGVGGTISMPIAITSMPVLKVDMSASAPDFEIDFPNYAEKPFEYVTEEAGSDNGYIRQRDGMCNTWDKSSNGLSHTPRASNGIQIAAPGTISVAHVVVHGSAATGSTANYDVVAGSVTAFPVTIEVYVDNGSTGGQLDGGDTFVASNVEDTVTDGPFSTVFFPYDANVILVVKSSAGCIDRILFTPNAAVLPVRLLSFDARNAGTGAGLQWQVAENESASHFVIEHSADGRVFEVIGTVSSTFEKGNAAYSFTHEANLQNFNYYRIKIVNQNTEITYSGTRIVKGTSQEKTITLLQNPVHSYLQFQWESEVNENGTVHIYNAAGARVYTQSTQVIKGLNTITMNLDGRVNTGVYVLEVISTNDRQTARFIKL